LPRAEVGDDQRILEDLALRVATADPRQVVECCLQQTDRLRVVAATECRRTRAESGRYFARRQAAVAGEALQFANAAPDAIVIADRGFRQRSMDIGKGEAGARKMLSRMRGDLSPTISQQRVIVNLINALLTRPGLPLRVATAAASSTIRMSRYARGGDCPTPGGIRPTVDSGSPAIPGNAAVVGWVSLAKPGRNVDPVDYVLDRHADAQEHKSADQQCERHARVR
jgi:hypothetical protein